MAGSVDEEEETAKDLERSNAVHAVVDTSKGFE
jgi:hypothetical protein